MALRMSARRFTAAALLVLALVAGMTVSGRALADPNPFGSGSAWSVPVRHTSALAPSPNGGAVINTAIFSGGVPAGGDALLGVDSTGQVGWRLPYHDQDVIGPGPLTDANGDHYYVINGSQLVAARGATERWSKALSDGNQLLAIGANKQVYLLSGSSLHGYGAASGAELFAPVVLNQFASGSYDRLFAYDKGLAVYSGYGKVVYLDYTGRVTAGPFTHTFESAGTFLRSISASATGDLFVVWYTEALTPDACLTDAGQTKLSKFTPAGLAWTKTLPHVSRCNYGGPYVNASPKGGAVITSDAANDTDKYGDVMYVDGAGQMVWQSQATVPPNTNQRTVEPARVDENGQVVLVSNYSFDCQLWSDYCSGTQIHRFGADGTPLSPIMLRSDGLTDQAGWTGGALALTPDRVLAALRHTDKGTNYPAETHYMVDAFSVPGLGAQYPEAALWKLMTNPLPSKLRIAAITDSVGSGEGINYRWHFDLKTSKNNGKNGVWQGVWVADELHPRWEPKDDNTPAVQNCHRSIEGYPFKVAAALDAELLNLSCSGASVNNGVLRRQTFSDGTQAAKPQLGSAEPGYDPPNPDYDAFMPDVVLLTLGADDVEFVKFVTACYKSAFELKLTRFCDADGALTEEADRLLAEQIVSLEKTINEITIRGAAAGKTPLIFLTTYYDPFPQDYVKCQDTTPLDAKITQLGVSHGEMSWMRDKLQKLNGNIRTVGKSHANVRIIELENALDGHRWCSKDPWVYGPSIAVLPGMGDNPSPFHPTWYGQTVIAEKVLTEIRKEVNY